MLSAATGGVAVLQAYLDALTAAKGAKPVFPTAGTDAYRRHFRPTQIGGRYSFPLGQYGVYDVEQALLVLLEEASQVLAAATF